MSPERWRQIEEMFQSAQQRPESERAQYLQEQCGEDVALREEVQSLLAREIRAECLLGIPAWQRDSLLLNALTQDARPHFAPGEALGAYEIVCLLGSGGMGEVYRARDSRLGREVALKVLPPDRLGDAERRKRFLQEARAASALNHPNVVTFYDLADARGETVLVMEYVPGKTLDDVIPPKGLPLKSAVDYAVQIVDGLAAAHAVGIVHRDLKPANVIVGGNGKVKLLDFGLAKLREPVDQDSDAVLTHTGVVLGTFAYMSPEQAKGDSVDARSDIFSFGCLLYEMLTGERPFRGGSPASIVSAILRDDPPEPACAPAGHIERTAKNPAALFAQGSRKALPACGRSENSAARSTGRDRHNTGTRAAAHPPVQERQARHQRDRGRRRSNGRRSSMVSLAERLLLA